MMITIDVDESILNDIYSTYGNHSFHTVESVLTDIINRYFNSQYFNKELQIEEYEDKSIDKHIINEIKILFRDIFRNNGFDDALFETKHFSNAIGKNNFVIPEYSIGKIYALAEIYNTLTNKMNSYGELIELLSSYDLNKH